MSPSRAKTAAQPEAQLSLEARFSAVTTTANVSGEQEETRVAPAAIGLSAAVSVVVAETQLEVPEPVPVEKTPRLEPRVYAVAELVRAARRLLETRFADVVVEGEISGCKRSGPGHFYFTLKDDSAQVDCVIFAREAGRLKFRLEDGLQVRCRGRVSLYEGRGRFQLCVFEIEPAGAGALALAFEQLKRKLDAEGLFEAARKRPLPFVPRRIGIVTSATGAVIRDIIRVAHRRFPVPLALAPTPVQGDAAAAQIIAALGLVVRAPEVDLVILARGGGSLEDLWCFNDEALARAIASCPRPVISAVGHETDFTIADFVADVRAPTPSAAAEIAVPVFADLETELRVLARRLARGAEAKIRDGRLRLERARGVISDPRRLLAARQQRVDELAARALEGTRAGITSRRAALRGVEGRLLRAHPQRRIADQRAALAALERRLTNATTSKLSPRRRELSAMQGKLDALSPLKVLERGYSLTRGADGRLVTRAGDVAPGQPVTITLREGELDVRVEATRGGAERPR